MKNPTTAVVDTLLMVKNLDKWNVQCYTTLKERYRVGVISLSVDIDKIKQFYQRLIRYKMLFIKVKKK